MPDVIIAPDCHLNVYNGHDDQIPMVIVTNLIAYQFYYDDTAPPDAELRVRKTTDGGATWGARSAAINSQNVEAGEAHAVYYANWTSGITTGIVHVIWTQLNRIVYRSFNPATDLFTPDISLAPTIVTNTGSAQASHVTIGVIESGELWCTFNSNDASLGRDVRRAPASGSPWTDPGGSNPMEADQGRDEVFIMPARTDDPRDMWLIYRDDSANQITLKAWDNSITDFLAESAVIRAHNWAAIEGAVAQRHSDGHLFLISHSNSSGAHDLTCTEIVDGTTFTNRANLLTGVTGPRRACITIDQRTGRLYVAWFTTLSSGVGAVEFSTSDDSGQTWTTPVRFSDLANGTLRVLWSALSIADGATGRWMPVWQDQGPEDLESNFLNSEELGVSVPAAVTGQQQKVLLL